jgi:hypothetical protein
MAFSHSPKIVTDGLILCLDAADKNSYPGSGTTWSDLSPNGNNGTLTNSPTFGTAGIASFNFNGTNEYVECGDVYAAEQMTLCAWIRLDVVPASQASGYPQLFGKRGVDTQRSYFFAFQKGSSKLYWELKNSEATYFVQYSTKTDWDVNTWYYCVATYVASTGIAKMYIDGVEDAGTFSPSQPWSLDPIPDTNATCRVGGGNYYLDGDMGVALFYNRALSAAEVSQNFNAQRSRFGV